MQVLWLWGRLLLLICCPAPWTIVLILAGLVLIQGCVGVGRGVHVPPFPATDKEMQMTRVIRDKLALFWCHNDAFPWRIGYHFIILFHLKILGDTPLPLNHLPFSTTIASMMGSSPFSNSWICAWLGDNSIGTGKCGDLGQGTEVTNTCPRGVQGACSPIKFWNVKNQIQYCNYLQSDAANGKNPRVMFLSFTYK